MTFTTAAFRSPKLVLIALAIVVAGASLAAMRLGQTHTVLLGFIGTLSGGNTHTAMQCLDGAVLAVEDCNASGGIDGAQVRLDVADDRRDPAIAAQIVDNFAKLGYWAVIGPTSALVAQDAASAAGNQHLLLISPTISTDACTKPSDSFASVRPALTVAADSIARHLRYKRNLLRTAIVMETASGQNVEDILRQAFTASGVACAGVFRIDGTSTDYADLASQVADTDADSVMILASGVETGMFLQHLRHLGCTLPTITYEPASTQDLIAYGGRAAEGITVITSIAPHADSERYRTFGERFQKRFGRAPDVAGIHSYEATRVALLSIAQSPSREEARRVMLSRQWFDGLQGRISMGRSGSPRRELLATQLRNGVFTVSE